MFLPAIALSILSGCATEVKGPPRPSYEMSGNILNALALQADRLSDLKARLRLRLTIHGHSQPGIRGQVMWAKVSGGELLRMTGIGLFGTTIFDCLVTKEAFYLFIPSHSVVYVTENRREIEPFIKRVSYWSLDPWAIVKTQDVRPISNKGRPDAPISIAFSYKGRPGCAEFAEETLMPISIRGPGLYISYMDPEVLSNGSLYPTRLHLEIKKLGLDMDVTLKDIQTDSVTPGDTAFDPAPFLTVPMVPLSRLLDSIRLYLRRYD